MTKLEKEIAEIAILVRINENLNSGNICIEIAIKFKDDGNMASAKGAERCALALDKRLAELKKELSQLTGK